MSFSRIMLGLFTLWLSLVGLAFGCLFVLCLSLYILWHGLSTTIIVSGGLCLVCTILVHLGLRRAGAKANPGVPASAPASLPEVGNSLCALPAAGRARTNSGRRKIL